MSGWIKLHRKIADNWIMRDSVALTVFLWCLLRATHRELRSFLPGNAPLKPGQFTTGRHIGAAALDLPPSTFWNALKRLEKARMVDITANNKFSVITIVNWAQYQLDDDSVDRPVDNKWTANGQQMDTKQEGKKVRNIFVAPTKEECMDFFVAAGSRAAEGEKFWNHFENCNWRLSGGRGAKMKDWNLAAKNWMRNDFSRKPAPKPRNTDDISKMRKEAGLE